MVTITDKQKCCGCAACVQACPKKCISLVKDNEGFLYPSVKKKTCIDCGLCEKVCPVLKPYESRPVEHIYAMINTDESVRAESSSGGIFSILAEKTISNGGVVFGAKFDENWQVLIDTAEELDALKAFRGSKYLQARVGDSFIKCKSYLELGRNVLFSGTPCQVAGLLHFLRKPYPNLLTVDFICHGVPSPAVWRRYLDEVVVGGSKAINDVQFRNKKNGWKKFSFSIEYRQENDSYLFCSEMNKNPFMRAFLSDLILRPSCYSCPTKCGKSNSDITIADFWGIQFIDASMDDDRGTSMVIIHNEKGMEYMPFEEIKLKEESPEALRYNSAYTNSSKSHPRRYSFFTAFEHTDDLHKLIEHSLRPTLSERIIYPFIIAKRVFFAIIKRIIRRTSKHKMGGAYYNKRILANSDNEQWRKIDDGRIVDVHFRNKRHGWKSSLLTISVKSGIE
jgi:coenzyme F420-reducing hydrogenase beta subunit